MWSYLLSAAGITGLLVAARHPRAGWTINICAQVLWVFFALATGQHGFLLAAAAYTVAYVRLLRRAAVAQPTPTVDSGRYGARVIRARLTLPAAALLALALAVTGCGADDTPLSAPSPTTAATSSAPTSSPGSEDSSAQISCWKNSQAQKDKKSDDPAVMAEVAQEAQKSTLPAIAQAGRFLDQHVQLAQAAQGQGDEVRMETALTAQSFTFTAECAKAGFVY